MTQGPDQNRGGLVPFARVRSRPLNCAPRQEKAVKKKNRRKGYFLQGLEQSEPTARNRVDTSGPEKAQGPSLHTNHPEEELELTRALHWEENFIISPPLFPAS